MNNFNLLPRVYTYQQLLLPFFLPYALYTGLTVLSKVGLSEWQIQLAKLITVTISLLYFRKNYRLGKFRIKHLFISLFFTPLALCIWIYPLSFFVSLHSPPANPIELKNLQCPEIYFYLRIFNSVILVALFEELLCRVYILEFLFKAGKNKDISSFLDRLLSPLDLKPDTLNKIPLSIYSVVGSTAIFTIGHDVNSYISAILYFSLTNLLYWRTRSVWVCVLVHSFTNLAVGLLVKYNAMNFLWF